MTRRYTYLAHRLVGVHVPQLHPRRCASLQVAVSLKLLWKVVFAGNVSIITKACAGMIEAVEVDSDFGPGSVTIMKLNPGMYQARNRAHNVVSPGLA